MSRLARCHFVVKVLVWAALGCAYLVEEPLLAVGFALYLLMIELLLVAEMDSLRSRLYEAVQDVAVVLPKLQNQPEDKVLKAHFKYGRERFKRSYTKLYGEHRRCSDE